MKKMKTKVNNKLFKLLYSKPFLALLGLLLLIYFIWFRFIRERAPKDIPFDLSLFGFLFLLLINIIYLYTIIRLIKPKSPTPFMLGLILMIRKNFLPWIILDEMLKANKFIRSFFEQSIQILFKLSNDSKIYTNNVVYCVLCIMVSKFIFIAVFLLDVFYFNKIEYYIHYLNTMYQVIITSEDSDNNYYFRTIESLKLEYQDYYIDLVLDIKTFSNLQAAAIMFDNTLYYYKCLVSYGLKLSEKPFYKFLPLIINNIVILDT